MKCCCGWVCHYFWTCTSPALLIGWLRLWMSLASSVGDARWKAMTQLGRTAELFTCSEWEKLRDRESAHKSSLCGGSIFQVADSIIQTEKSLWIFTLFLCWSSVQSLFCLFSIPHPRAFQKKARFHRAYGKYFRGWETNHSCPPPAFPDEIRGFCRLHFLQQSPRSCLARRRQDLVLKFALRASTPRSRPAPTPLCANTSIHLLPRPLRSGI